MVDIDITCKRINANDLYKHSIMEEKLIGYDLNELNTYHILLAEFYFKESDIQSGSFLLPERTVIK